MGIEDDIVKKWLAVRATEENIINGTATDHEVLGAIAGVPPQAIALIEQRQAILVLTAKIERWWRTLPAADKPPFMSMHQFLALFGGTHVGAWQIGTALRNLQWKSARRNWKESTARVRLWLPPDLSG